MSGEARRPRTPEQREVWEALNPWQRYLLTSHRPDDLERDLALRHSIGTALENVFGPREWTAAAARVEDGEAPERDPFPEPEYAMTYEEIGEVFGLSRERIRSIIQEALGKIRRDSWHLLGGTEPAPSAPPPRVDAPRSTPEEIDAAIRRAKGLPSNTWGPSLDDYPEEDPELVFAAGPEYRARCPDCDHVLVLAPEARPARQDDVECDACGARHRIVRLEGFRMVFRRGRQR